MDSTSTCPNQPRSDNDRSFPIVGPEFVSTVTEAAEHDRDGLSPTIEVRNLHRFFGSLRAVDNVSFSAVPGQVMGFIGPNGAGKTTTMRILATLDLPTAGDVLVRGESVIDEPDKVRRVLGFMPDSFGRYPNMNIVEYLDFFARAYGFRGAERRDAVERVLDFTELAPLATKPIATLSKGMSQRLCLGRTLVHDPDVLILDEPAAGLDPRARVELRELIQLLATQMHKTVLISSHILTELGEICDSVVIIEAGKILAAGSIEELQRGGVESTEDDTGGQSLTEIVITVLGDTDELERVLVQQAFVQQVSVAGQRATVSFSGDDVAQHDLLKALVNLDVRVVRFEAKTQTLEDTFMRITQGKLQ
ncbi:MAG: multidrug ABC transporter ATP-binding protein [Planctomycetaceae bacterium]|nr:multidrug ABC transporter ATP-binding protein [Planctomycetaceae bacterium]